MLFVLGRCEVLNQVGHRECSDKCHRGEHHEAVTLVDFDAEVSRNIFENHVCLQVVQEQESKNLEVIEVFLSCIVNCTVGEVNCTDGEQVVEVTEERVRKFAVIAEFCGHHFPVLGEVFEKVTVGFEFATLETEPLEIADGEECRHREKRKHYKEYRCF